MMATVDPQIVDNEEFIPILDYEFSGDNSTVESKRRFIEAYREEGSIYHAAQVARIHRTTVYKWLERDPEFVTALDDSREDNYDQVETSVFKKAVNGDTLSAIFYLKAHRHKFRDKVQVDINVVQDEINQRMEQLGLKQLPQATTEFIPVPQREITMNSLLQFSSPCEDRQKEE